MAQICTTLAHWTSILAWERTSQWNSNLSYKKLWAQTIAFSPSTPKLMGEWLGRTLTRNGHVYTAIGKRAKIGSLAKHATANSFTWASYSFFEQRGSLLYNGLTKNQERYHTSFNHQRSTKRPKSNAKMYVNQRCEDWRENKALITSRSFPREIPVLRRFCEHRFHHFPLKDFSQTNGNRLVGAPRAHFRQKLKIDKLPKLLL